MWEIPQLPHMQNLKHLTVAVSMTTTSDFMWTCLGQLEELRTLDLKLLSVESMNVVRLLLTVMIYMKSHFGSLGLSKLILTRAAWVCMQQDVQHAQPFRAAYSSLNLRMRIRPKAEISQSALALPFAAMLHAT